VLVYVGKRLLIAVPTLLGVATVSFLLMRLIPGDPAQVMLGPTATAQEIARFRVQLGLDKPLWYQYVHYLGVLAQGNLGSSATTGRPVIDEIAARAPYTIELAVFALLLAVLVGCGLGLAAALRRDSLTDMALSGFSVAGVSMPVYWLGLLLVLVFAVKLRLLPAAGAATPQSFILPVVTLSLFTMGFISRQTRSALIEVLDQDFIRNLRAKGLRRRSVIGRHALRNASLPILTVIGLQFSQMIGGAVLTETVFAWPGLGQLLVNSINARDYVTVQGITFVLAVTVVMVNIVIDILYAYLDPRIRYD